MKKGIRIVLGIAGSIALGGASYLVSNSLYFFLGVSSLFLLCSLLLIHPWLNYRHEKNRKQMECYQFLSSFIVNYSITSSLDKSFNSALMEAKGELKEIQKSIANEDTRSQIFYLEHYFESDSYSMFLSLYQLHETQGGELLNISKTLLDELTRMEESRTAIEKESRRNLLEFSTTWGLSVLLLCFLRFALATFYNTLAQSTLFLAGIGMFFAFLCFSICLYFYLYCAKPPFRRKKKA